MDATKARELLDEKSEEKIIKIFEKLQEPEWRTPEPPQKTKTGG